MKEGEGMFKTEDNMVKKKEVKKVEPKVAPKPIRTGYVPASALPNDLTSEHEYDERKPYGK